MKSTNKSKDNKNKNKNKNKDWNSYVPQEVRNDIEFSIKKTRENDRENSLTFCKIKGQNKIHTSAYTRGKSGVTEVSPCQEKFGPAEKQGDFHTHPVDAITIGTTPSPGDYTANLNETGETRIRQISCISNHASKFIRCIQPKKIPDRKKLNSYNRALEANGGGTLTDPFFPVAVSKDFTHSFYDRESYRRIKNPSPTDIINDSLGQTTKLYRKDQEEVAKGTFCDIIQAYNKPDDNRVGIKCREMLKDKRIEIAIPKTPLGPETDLKVPGIDDIPEIPYVEKIERIPVLGEFTHL